jgi:hypothetical protein
MRPPVGVLPLVALDVDDGLTSSLADTPLGTESPGGRRLMVERRGQLHLTPEAAFTHRAPWMARTSSRLRATGLGPNTFELYPPALKSCVNPLPRPGPIR